MNHAAWRATAAFIVTIGLSAQPIEYFVEESGEFMHTILRAKENGKTYTLIDQSKDACLAIVDQRDWDGNGLTDALVADITACGGNCCPNTFFFVSALGNGRFVVSDDFGDSWADPSIEKWNGRWSVVIVSKNEGLNTDRPKEITRRYVLRKGKGVKVEESLRKEIDSLLDLRSETFKGDNDEQRIEFDLDGDGKKDIISGRLWERWGRIRWRVSFANGKEADGPGACKRIGVLKTTTKGVHDLVCDQDTVIRWTGSEYSDGSKPAVQPSFNCAKATTPVERLICRDARLATLELGMVADYKQALSRLSPEGQLALRRDHAAWLKNYSRTCNASPNDTDRAPCIAGALSTHAANLKNRHE